VRGLEALAFCRQVAPGSDLGHGWSIRPRVWLFFVIIRLCGVIGGSILCLLQLDVGLSSGQDFAYPSDIMRQKVLV